MRDLEPAGEAANHTRNHVEPLALAKLLALREEELIAEADAEKRASSVEGSPERLEETGDLWKPLLTSKGVDLRALAASLEERAGA